MKIDPARARREMLREHVYTEADFEGELSAPPTPPAPGRSSAAGELLPTLCAASLADLPIPRREWHVPGLVPGGVVTTLSGDGGTGKSLLALQLAASTALGRPWIGFDVPRVPALYLSAEDETAEVHRRLADVAVHLGSTIGAMTDLTIAPLADRDALLAVPDRVKGDLRSTPLYRELDAAIGRCGARLVVLDTLADLHAGDEINRAHARQFIGLLRRLAIARSATVLLLAHPSLSGIASGSGSSGSTAWNASVRSRLYLTRPRDERDDPCARVLQPVKANYAPASGEFRLRWSSGVFVREGSQTGVLSALAMQAKAEQVFLEQLIASTASGRNVSDAGPRFAPKAFEAAAHEKGVTKSALSQAMGRLFDRGTIRLEPYGPPSKGQKRIVIAGPSDQ